jgi:dTDP-4-dehydrorhamnose reductase
MRVLVLGATGQLGSDLVRTHPGHALTALGRDDLDLTDTVALGRAVSAARPDWVLNAAADNRTEAAEDNPDAAFAVNARAVRALVASCAAAGARLLQFSTDFVFDGRKGAPYVESDAPNPVNAYGRSKHEGERFVLAAGPAHLVVRSAGLFGRAGSRAKGGNFVDAIAARARRGEPVRAVTDIAMSPTSTADLAVKTWELIGRSPPGGVYHLVNAGGASIYDLALDIVAAVGGSAAVTPVSAKEWPGKMHRAPDTRLASDRLPALGVAPLRPWREALADYLRP